MSGDGHKSGGLIPPTVPSVSGLHLHDTQVFAEPSSGLQLMRCSLV